MHAPWFRPFALTGLAATCLALAGCSLANLPFSLASEPTPPAKQAEPAPPAVAISPPATRATMIEPMIEKRDTLTATGYAVISLQKGSSPAQQRLLAIRASKLDAYRALTEQVYGQYLDSTTTVSEMVVLSDSFRARVEGVIYGAVLVSVTPVGEDTYEATLSLDSAVVNDLRMLYLGQIAAKKQTAAARKAL